MVLSKWVIADLTIIVFWIGVWVLYICGMTLDMAESVINGVELLISNREGMGIPHVLSVSGGKTSTYMALHYPADYYIFSLIRIDAKYCRPKDDGIVRYVSDKIGFDFVATAESDKVLYVMRELEQRLGKEVVWVTGDSFDEVVRKRKMIPNMVARFCTTDMKIEPIFKYCHNVIGSVVNMGIGFRFDELERANSQNTHFKTIVGKSSGGRNKWAEVYWRELYFPLIEDKITHYPVYQWSLGSGFDFTFDSNCVGCFWKPVQQLRKNWDDEPLKMRWFSELEQKYRRTFKKGVKYENIKKMGLQSDFNFGTGAGCQAGFCID